MNHPVVVWDHPVLDPAPHEEFEMLSVADDGQTLGGNIVKTPATNSLVSTHKQALIVQTIESFMGSGKKPISR